MLKNAEENNYQPQENQNKTTENTQINNSPIKTSTDLNKNQVCLNDQNCEKYLAIWKQLQEKYNNMSEVYLNKHLYLQNASFEKWNSGESFSVQYYYKFDWFSVFQNDSFLVKLSPIEDTFTYLNLPKGKFLEKDQIEKVVDRKAFSSFISKIISIDKLSFDSYNKARNFINLSLDKVSNINIVSEMTNGYPALKGNGTLNTANNQCVSLMLNLYNAEQKTQNIPCVIN